MLFLDRMKPFIAVVFLQLAYAGMDVLTKVVLNDGMSNYVLLVYDHFIAFVVMAPFALILERRIRPKITFAILMKIVALSLLGPVMEQNLCFLGMKYTTATFTAAMLNVLPAITFVLACILKLEKIKIRNIHSQAKMVGTIVTIAGAIVMALIKGPQLFGRQGRNIQTQHNGWGVNLQHAIKGSLMIIIGCISGAGFMVLQAITLETYPAELSLTTLICLLGAVEGGIVGLIMERGEPSVWSLNWDTKLLVVVYNGIVCSAVAYYIQAVVMRYRGPVYITTFNPLCMVIVAIMGYFFLAEKTYLGSVIGSITIILGLYLVIWGKSNDYDPLSPVNNKEDMLLPQESNYGEDDEHSNHEVVINTSSK